MVLLLLDCDQGDLREAESRGEEQHGARHQAQGDDQPV